jgi:dTDP-4-dehydrorhamnose 3,5-epimerase
MIEGVIITQLDIIDTPGGNVMHAMKVTSAGYSKFGEAYFSQAHSGAIKAWKRHKAMVLNLVVPVGAIRFVLYDDRKTSGGKFQEVILSKENYCRLTIPPMIWVGFQGLDSDVSLLLNIANIVHLPEESDRKPIDSIKYEWS